MLHVLDDFLARVFLEIGEGVGRLGRVHLFENVRRAVGVKREGNHIDESRYLYYDGEMSITFDHLPKDKYIPPHDHGVWEAMAIYSGQLKHVVYDRMDDGSKEGYAELEIVDDRVLERNDMAMVAPPQEIHSFTALTDGEQFRKHFVHEFLKGIEGIDQDKKTLMGIRDNRYDLEVPTVTGPLSRPKPVHVEEFKFVRALTDRTLKFTLPGPMTISTPGCTSGLPALPTQVMRPSRMPISAFTIPQ